MNAVFFYWCREGNVDGYRECKPTIAKYIGIIKRFTVKYQHKMEFFTILFSLITY